MVSNISLGKENQIEGWLEIAFYDKNFGILHFSREIFDIFWTPKNLPQTLPTLLFDKLLL